MQTDTVKKLSIWGGWNLACCATPMGAFDVRQHFSPLSSKNQMREISFNKLMYNSSGISPKMWRNYALLTNYHTKICHI